MALERQTSAKGQLADVQWLRGIVPLLDLFILLFAAMLVVLTDMQERKLAQQEAQAEKAMASMADPSQVAKLEVDSLGALQLNGAVLEHSRLPEVFKDFARDGRRVVIVTDPHRKLAHGVMRRVRAAAGEAGVRAVYSNVPGGGGSNG